MVFKKDEEWLTTKEAARYLKVSPNALRIMVHKRKIKAHKIGNRLRFKREDINILIKKKDD
ncbi:MAG: helix-turn-helix domain-containing protein [Bacteriovoracales bacterium]|nr:helix-turn-helix domain-containing protein [Bacteriovoracales bacterium]